ncbi:MAG TPA: 16S rRNA (uracil(1498)-N(3))-methyltransferase [Pirellulales bacterium]|nr:16S rRNA (uracil(1498)-N(3))-methyltransferase [Pirellulales bacterium]
MADRYFVEAPIVGNRVKLTGDEAHHLLHVMRAKPGQAATLFDGSGAEFLARIERLGRREVELAIVERMAIDRELPLEATLSVALPKGDRQRWLVEKAVELGVARLVPLETARGVAQPVDKALVRLRRAVIEASKQCGRNRLMEIAASESWASDCSAPKPPGCLRVLADPSGKASLREILSACPAPSSVQAAIGPEGGWTDEELSLARDHGWQIVGLGPRILRVETAALAVAAVVGQAFQPDSP